MKSGRKLAIIAVVVGLVAAACGLSESDTSEDRDRNTPIVGTGTADAQLGVNSNGVAVNALRDERGTTIGDTRAVTLVDGQTVYGVVRIVRGGAGRDNTEFEFKVVRINETYGQPKFDKAYGVKTLKAANAFDVGSNFIPTKNGYGILIDNDEFAGTAAPTLTRYRLNSLVVDTAFGVKGTIVLPDLAMDIPAKGSVVLDVADQSDGFLLVLVEYQDREFVMRIDTSGSLDFAFNGNGVVELPSASAPISRLRFERLAVAEVNNSRFISAVGIGRVTNESDVVESVHLVEVRISDSGVVDIADLDSQVASRDNREFQSYEWIRDVVFDASGETARAVSQWGSYRDSQRPPLRIGTSSSSTETTSEYQMYSYVRPNDDDTRLERFAENDTFEAPWNTFAADERFMSSMISFVTNSGLFRLGTVMNRASNFSGLATGRDRYGSFDLYDIARVADYPTTRAAATRLRTAADGSINFSLVGLGQERSFMGLPLDEGDIGLVQATWGVSMTDNGLPVPSFGGDTVWAKTAPTIDYLTSYFARENAEDLGRSFTIMGDDASMYVVDTVGDGYPVRLRKVDLVAGTLGQPMVLDMPAWFMSWLPATPDAMVVRDGYLYIASEFNSTINRWPWVTGVARWSLVDGKLDESFGDEGVYPVTQGWQIPRNKILILHQDETFDLAVQYLGDDERVVRVWSSPEQMISPDEMLEGSNDQPTVEYRIIDDVYSDGDTSDGPIAFTTDIDGRLIVARVRRQIDRSNRTVVHVMRVWRYLPNGEPDEMFGEGGYVEYDVFGWSSISPNMEDAPQVVETPDGRLLLGFLGRQLVVNDEGEITSQRTIHVLSRLKGDGSLDALVAPKSTPLPIAAVEPALDQPSSAALATPSPAPAAPAAAAPVATVEKLDPAPIVQAEATSAAGAAPRLQIVAMTNAIDRSIGVKWSIPQSLVGQSVTYQVTANPSGKTCTTTSTLCVFRNLDPWTAYSFSVAVTSGAVDVLPSNSSSAVKPLRLLARNKTVKVASLITPAAKSKATWKVSGGCKLSSDKVSLTTPKDATTCILSVQTAKSGKTPRTTRSITIDVRAVVN